MNDPSGSSREPRAGGADTHATIGETIRDWFRAIGRSRNGDASLRESLEEVIEEHEEAATSINPEERLMLMNILSFSEKRVDDVMVPRADIVAIEIDTPLDQVVQLFRTAVHSRIPVYRDTLDDILGMIHIKDLVQYWGVTGVADLTQMTREPLFVPPSMSVLELLLQMRASRTHMAIVVDEYGGTDGLATIEDVVEEIIGDIQDEHDVGAEPEMVQAPDGSIEADARARIEEFERRFACDPLIDEEDEEIETLGGLVFAMLGRVPKRGEMLRHPCGLEIEVIDVDPRRIKRLRLRKIEPFEDTAT